MEILKRLFTSKTQNNKGDSKAEAQSGVHQQSNYASVEEMKTVTDKSIKEIGPVLKKLANE